MEKAKRKINLQILLPTVHLILSFFYERLVLKFHDEAAVAFSVPLNNTFSTFFEKVLCYTMAKIMAAVIIFALWKLFFVILDKKTDREVKTVFLCIFAVLAVALIIRWPEVFTRGGDNFIPYSYAVRLMPEFWHSIWLSCLYTASFMVFPHAVSINLLQLISFVFSIAYLYNRIKQSPLFAERRWVRFLVFPMFLFRDMWLVATNPERAEYNVSFTLLFVTIVIMDIAEKKRRSTAGLIKLTVFAAFLAVFRSEGIVVGTLGFAVLVLFLYRDGIKKIIGLFALFAAVFVLFSLPSKVGEIKYYGSDYSIMNTFPTLANILNSPAADLIYSGAGVDLKALEAVTPLELIKEQGSFGYRAYNYSQGRFDINQSCVDKETASSYMSAYRRVVLHNPLIYLKTQWTGFLQAIGAGSAYVEPYRGQGAGYEPFGYELWNVGISDVNDIPGRFKWENLGIRSRLAGVLTGLEQANIYLHRKLHLYTILIVLEILVGVVLIVKTIADLIRKRFSGLGPGLILCALDIYLVLMALMMPTGYHMYFHAYIYAMFAAELLFVPFWKKKKN